VSIRAVPTSNAPVEVLKLSRADFEAGFMFENQKPGAPHAQHDATRTTTLRRRASVVPSASTSEVRSEVGTFTEEELRTKLLGFIRMVSRKQLTTLERGESVFQSGDPADRFYILASGELAVDTKGVGAKRLLEAVDSGAVVSTGIAPERTVENSPPVIREGEGFGEWALLRNLSRAHTVYCASEKCEVVSILSRDFLQLVNKSEVVRRSFKELQKGAGGSRPSLFVANRPMPEKPPPPKKLPIHAYK
jgi:hypothetical protein